MSGSLSATDFFNEINFVIQIIDSFTNPRNRFGYLLFNNGFESTTLNSNPMEVKDQLRAVQYQGGGTSFLPALEEILNNHFTPLNMRNDASRILFFLTDGVSSDNQTDIVVEANMLKTASRVRIATVGFGAADLNALKEIASEGFNFEFDDLDAASQALSELVEISCVCESTILTRLYLVFLLLFILFILSDSEMLWSTSRKFWTLGLIIICMYVLEIYLYLYITI